MSQQETEESAWRKSSHSDAQGNGDCVEVRFRVVGAQVRDSKAPEAGELGFSATAWRAFLDRH